MVAQLRGNTVTWNLFIINNRPETLAWYEIWVQFDFRMLPLQRKDKFYGTNYLLESTQSKAMKLHYHIALTQSNNTIYSYAFCLSLVWKPGTTKGLSSGAISPRKSVNANLWKQTEEREKKRKDNFHLNGSAPAELFYGLIMPKIVLDLISWYFCT